MITLLVFFKHFLASIYLGWGLRRRIFILALTLVSTVSAQESSSPAPPSSQKKLLEDPSLAPLNRSMGGRIQGKQFIIYGGRPLVRHRILDLAKKLDTALSQYLGDGTPKTPIIIELLPDSKETPRSSSALVRPHIYQIGGGRYRLQLDLTLAKGFYLRSFQESLLDLILIERSLQNLPPKDSPDTLSIPPWLRMGLLEAIAWQEKRVDHEFYAALFESGGLFPLERLLSQKEVDSLDAGTRSAFQASSGALVLSLLKQPQGKQSFQALLTELPSYQGEYLLLLRKHFDGLNLSPQSLSKWWQLQMAKLAEAPVTRLMSILQTEKQLRDALHLQHQDETRGLIQYQPSSYLELLDLPSDLRIQIIQPALDELSLLLYRSFPNYRPLITGYMQLLHQIIKAPNTPEQRALLQKNLSSYLKNITYERTLMLANGQRVRDYLDWYHINTSATLSGEFTQYLSLKTDLQNMNLHSPSKSPIGRYLDALEALYRNP